MQTAGTDHDRLEAGCLDQREDFGLAFEEHVGEHVGLGSAERCLSSAHRLAVPRRPISPQPRGPGPPQHGPQQAPRLSRSPIICGLAVISLMQLEVRGMTEL